MFLNLLKKKIKILVKILKKEVLKKKNIDAFKCSECGLWVTKSCDNQNCPTNL